MTSTGRNLTLAAAAVAAALLLAPGAGMTTTLDAVSATSLARQMGTAADDATVILAKDKGPGGLKCCGNGGGGGIPPGPGDLKPGGGKGGGGKGGGGKGGGWSHHHGWGAAIGGAIVLGMGYCAAQSERCADEYGDNTGRYWRCMRRAGCSD
jgi:hypothetical protein